MSAFGASSGIATNGLDSLNSEWFQCDDVSEIAVNATGRHQSIGATPWRAVAVVCAALATIPVDGRGDVPPPVETNPATAAPATALPYWQAPPLPTAVIQGGAIPPGWQPQAVPYQGIGPDGQPLTMYFAPTYVFTYQAGPPVLAVPQVSRGGVARTAPAAATPPNGWNYATSGAQPATMSLTPGSVSRYRAAYRLPPDSRALAGTPLVPPGPLPSQPAMPTEAWASAPATQSAAPQYAMGPPPTEWAAASPQQPPVEPMLAAAGAGATAAAVIAQPSPPIAAIAQPPAPPPVNAPVLEPLPPQPASDGSSPPPRPLNARTWRVVGVYDGDSLTCLDENSQQQRVRLASIDAPEGGQPYAKEARDALAALVFGRTVEVIDDGRDPAGRLIAQVSVNGTDVARELVATGNAWAAPTSTDSTLTAAQSAAQAAKLGIWSQANPTAPWDYRSGG